MEAWTPLVWDVPTEASQRLGPFRVNGDVLDDGARPLALQAEGGVKGLVVVRDVEK